MANNKKRFFIFLDIDGVMYDLKYFKQRMVTKYIKRETPLTKFKPESVEALNYLIKKLSNDYSVHLVISSSWRHNFSYIINTLLNNGVNLPYEVDRTCCSKNRFNRAKHIFEYLKEKELSSKSDCFVIIDDERFNFNKYFNKSVIIKTNKSF